MLVSLVANRGTTDCCHTNLFALFLPLGFSRLPPCLCSTATVSHQQQHLMCWDKSHLFKWLIFFSWHPLLWIPPSSFCSFRSYNCAADCWLVKGSLWSGNQCWENSITLKAAWCRTCFLCFNFLHIMGSYIVHTSAELMNGSQDVKRWWSGR